MAILLTGGAGYIGSHTAVELQNSGYEIIIVDNFYNSKPEVLKRIENITGKSPTFYECDIRDRDGLRKIFKENDIEGIIHFAGLKAVGESVKKPLEYFDNNVGGTVILCEVMAEFNCKNIVFSSSATVYGMNNISPLTENMPIGGVTNPYGRTKWMIEDILRDLCFSDSTWSAVLLRYFNPIGAHKSGTIGEDPSDIPNNLMPYVSQVAVGKLDKLSVFGGDYDTPDGTGVRDYIHVVDLAKGHVKAVKYVLSNKGDIAINLGTGIGYSVLDIVNTFERVNNVKVPYSITERRGGDIATCFSTAALAKEKLDWQADHSLEDMCRDSWKWQSNNPEGYN